MLSMHQPTLLNKELNRRKFLTGVAMQFAKDGIFARSGLFARSASHLFHLGHLSRAEGAVMLSLAA